MRKQGFTLVEIIVAVTILSLVMISVFGIYSNIIALNKRLSVARTLQENARNVTEIIAKDVRDSGIAFACYGSSGTCGSAIGGTDYSGSWADVLVTKVASENCPGGSDDCKMSYYLMHDRLATGPTKCMAGESDCYLGRELPDGQRMRLTDKGVNIENLQFFISGVDSKTFSSHTDSEWKVTMAFTISVAPRQGISSDVAKSLVIPIQTTITEKLYKAH